MYQDRCTGALSARGARRLDAVMMCYFFVRAPGVLGLNEGGSDASIESADAMSTSSSETIGTSASRSAFSAAALSTVSASVDAMSA